MVNAVATEHSIPVEEAYDIVITWIAVQIHLEEQLGTEGIQLNAYKKLYELFDLSLLQVEKWDWLGEAGVVLGVWPKGFPDKEAYELKAVLTTSTIPFNGGMPKAILVKNTWTGRDIFALHTIGGDRAIYFATEQDIRLYRTAVLNMRIHNIPAHILFADNTISTSLDSENWRCANLWNPVKLSKLKSA